ncbi:hypothetical protein K457DRAFT_131407 [Linnemannia elongata AG-77]|uniref:Uncharacterized protein n=1 Tax=Linnemannia elongata AG-77 TaxID=1314771 RepID=A0A197JAX6_9FUNG|nr:hypothetical protein K457DRAFT_131407 [Linnemannia elongata AG-77]
MKTKVDRIREEWYTVVLSTEEEVQDMTLGKGPVDNPEGGWLLAMGTPYTSSVCSIIDTEYTHGEYSGMDPDGDSLGGCSKDTLHGRYHAFDLAIPGEHTLVHRLQLLEDIVDKIKDHVPVVIKEYHRIQYPGDRIDAIKCYWKKMSQRNVDGMIFVDGSREYLGDVYKWKPVTTVDLLIRNEKELYAAHGKHIPELALDTGGVTVIDDTVYEMELCRGGVAKIVRARKDKPSPNSIRVVLSNIRACALGNIWDEDSCHLLRIYHSRIRKELMGKSALDITGMSPVYMSCFPMDSSARPRGYPWKKPTTDTRLYPWEMTDIRSA